MPVQPKDHTSHNDQMINTTTAMDMDMDQLQVTLSTFQMIQRNFVKSLMIQMQLNLVTQAIKHLRQNTGGYDSK